MNGLAPTSNVRFLKLEKSRMNGKFTERKFLDGSLTHLGMRNSIFTDDRDFEWEGLRTSETHARLIAMAHELAKMYRFPTRQLKLCQTDGEYMVWVMRSKDAPQEPLNKDDVFTLYLLGSMNMDMSMPFVEFETVENIIKFVHKDHFDKYINETIDNQYSDDSDEEDVAYLTMNVTHGHSDYYFNNYPWENIEGLNVLNVCRSQKEMSEYFIKKIHNFDFTKLLIMTELLCLKYFPHNNVTSHLVINNMKTRISLLKKFTERQQINEKTMWSA